MCHGYRTSRHAGECRQQERAAGSESTGARERAAYRKSTAGDERVVKREGAVGLERTVKLTDDEARFLIALLRANASFHEAQFERRDQVRAELLIRKIASA